MPRISLSFCIVLMLAASVFSSVARAESEPDPDRVLVQFVRLDAQARRIVASAGGRVLRELPELNTVAVRLPPAARATLAANPRVLLVEPDAPRYAIAETLPWGVERVEADRVWGNGGETALRPGAPAGEGIRLCVIDSGAWTSHPDLSGRFVGGYPSGWNQDRCGHGTHVAGTLAAAVNGRGVVGVAPKAELYAVKVFGNDCRWTYVSDLVDAANRCRDAGAKIINMSLGGSWKSRIEEQAFARLYERDGILSVAAAGNGGNGTRSYPASYPEVISVAATDRQNRRASFSQHNSDVELAAPGVGVLSTVPWGSNGVYPGEGYESWSGTSMATPHVAAAAALVWSARPELTNVEVRSAMRETALDLGAAGRDNEFGFGLVQARRAIDSLGSTSPRPPPRVVITSPQDGGSHEQGRDILFTGTATDAEGRSLSASLSWTSSIDGAIGTGGSFVTTLSAGTHAITARAIDGEGAEGQASISIGVSATSAPPPEGRAPVISNVQARQVHNNGTFEVTWSTDIPADSRVRLTCCGTYSSADLVTTHRMPVRQKKWTTYEFFVQSAAADGTLGEEAGPFVIQIH